MVLRYPPGRGCESLSYPRRCNRGFEFSRVGHGHSLSTMHAPCSIRCASLRREESRREAAIDFFMEFATCSAPMVAIENPVCIMSTQWRKPNQIIQPWQFGHGETKRTCLWLKGLPALEHTNVVEGREQRIWKMGPSPERAKERSRTFAGIADAMAGQWGNALLSV